MTAMPIVTFEAVQERPRYWDGRGPRMSHERIAREHATLAEAERYARRILGQRPGVPVEIYRRSSAELSEQRVAIVQRDALGRTWTDVQVMEPLL